MKRLGFTVGVLLAAWSCGTEPQFEDYGITDLSQIALTSTNHAHGFGRAECFNCHVITNIHQVNRVNSDSVALARVLVGRSGLTSCRGCHGTNGVSP